MFVCACLRVRVFWLGGGFFLCVGMEMPVGLEKCLLLFILHVCLCLLFPCRDRLFGLGGLDCRVGRRFHHVAVGKYLEPCPCFTSCAHMSR